MGFLTALLNDIVTVGKIFIGFAPLVEAAAPSAAPALTTASNDIANILNAVVAVETQSAAISAGGTTLTAAQKTSMIAALVTPIITAANGVAGKTIADPTGFQNGVNLITQGAEAIVAAFHTDVVAQVTTSAVKVKT